MILLNLNTIKEEDHGKIMEKEKIYDDKLFKILIYILFIYLKIHIFKLLKNIYNENIIVYNPFIVISTYKKCSIFRIL